jgi:hypothetical protein
MMPAMWTTQQVADHLGLTVEEVYRSRREQRFPGNLGVRRGRRLMFDPDHIANPPTQESTTDPAVAALWEIQGVRKVVNKIDREVQALRAHLAQDANLTLEEE